MTGTLDTWSVFLIGGGRRGSTAVAGCINTERLDTPGYVKALGYVFPAMMFFVLMSNGLMISEGSNENEAVILGEAETANYAECPWTEGMYSQMRYCQALDKEDDCDLWNVKAIVEHRVRKRRGKGHQLEVKAKFKDPGESEAWVDMFAVAMQDPLPVVDYARKKHLTEVFVSFSRKPTRLFPNGTSRVYLIDHPRRL